MRVQGAWMTKLEAVVRRILWLKAASPSEKSLVFSAFPKALDWLANALKLNGIQSVKLATDVVRPLLRWLPFIS